MGIKLRKKQLQSGRASLFLDICWNGQRWKEYLGICLENPAIPAALEENVLKMRTAMNLCEERKRLLQQYKMPAAKQSSVDFLKIFDDYVSSYGRKDIKVAKAVLRHLRKFVEKPELPLACLDKTFCEGFLGYLLENLQGNTPVGYFKKFKMCLAMCVEKGILQKNPAAGIRLSSSEAITKDILSNEEIQQLADTPLPCHEVKRAFLFACHTGLRWCDIADLRYKAVDFERNMLTVCQRKVMHTSTKAVLHLNMNKTAFNLLCKSSGLPDEKVFNLPSYSYTRRLLIDWAHRAGIRKHITFHCARHSFITNIMLGGANIKTASLLAGHSTIRHTEKYIHIIDEVKQRAVDSLPELELKEDL